MILQFYPDHNRRKPWYNTYSMQTMTKEVVPSQKIITRYLQPRVFLTSKRKNMVKGLQSVEKTFHEQQVIKKYFGHKITFINTPKQLLRSSSRYQSIKSASFIQDPKTKPIHYHTSILSINDHLMLTNEFLIRKKDFIRVVVRMKPLVKLENTAHLKNWVSFPNRIKYRIQHQSFRSCPKQEREEDDDNESQNERENCLRYSYEGEKFDSGVLFSRMKNLKSLDLDLRDFCLSSKELLAFLKNLKQSKLSQWYISISVKPCFLNKAKELEFILREIDFLGFQFEQTGQYIIYYDRGTEVEGYKYSTLPLDRKRYLIEKRYKVLDIFIKTDFHNTKVGFLQFLDYCVSLKGLFIKVLGNPILDELNSDDEDEDEDEARIERSDEEDEGNSNLDINYIAKKMKKSQSQKKTESNLWAKNLKDAVLCFNFIEDEYDNFFNRILKTLENDCPRLKTFELFSCSTITFIKDYYDNEEEEVETTINNISSLLFQISSLEELTLSTNLRYAKGLGKAIKIYKALERLTVNVLKCDETSAWDDYFPFKDLGNIKELTIIIRPDFMSKDWGIKLAKNLSNLEKLEVLKIQDESKGMMSLKALDLFVKNLKPQKNIKSVYIRTRIKSLLVLNKETLHEELEICIKEKEEEILQKVQRDLDDLIKSNQLLRNFYIGKLIGFKYKAIKY